MNSKLKLSLALSFVAAFTFAALFMSMPSAAFAVTSAEKQAEADAAYAQISDMQATLDAKSDEYFTALDEKDAATAAMDEAQTRENEANAQIAVLQSHLSERARSMYRNGNTSFLDVLFGAASFDEFTTNWDLLNELSADDANSIAQTKDLEAQAAAAHEEYQQQEQVAAQKVAEAEQAKADAEQTIEAQRALAASLDAEVSQLVAQEQQAAAEAAAQAAAQAQAAAAAQAAGTTADGTTADGTTTDSGSADSGSSSASSGGSYDGGSDAVSRAYACLGAPYVWGAAGPGSYDCSGLVSYCITGTHSHVFTSSELNTYPAVSDPSPGDVCVRDGHCGIYIGGGQYINAATEGVGVIISSVPGDMKIVRP